MTTQFAPIWDDAAVAFTTIKANATDTASAAATTLLDLRVNNVSKFVVDKFGELILTPTTRTSGSDSLLSLIAPADTTRAAGVEATDINFNLARTVQFAAGNITNQRAVRIQAPTYSFASASTITTAATLSIDGPPTAGTNATLTNRWALNVESGDIRLSSNAAVVWPNGISIRDNSPSGFGLTIVPPTAVPTITLFANALIKGFYTNHTLDIGHNTCQIRYGSSAYAPDVDTDRIVIKASDGLHVRHSSPTSAGKLCINNTFTDNSNYERLSLQFGTYSSVRHAQIAAESAGTGTANINLVLTPKGTGAFILGPPPDGTTTGGNVRGSRAVDLQTLRSASTQVASGQHSFLVGRNNTGSGWYSTVTGQNCVGSGWYTLVAGNENTVSGEASFALGYLNQISGNYSGAAGFDNIIGGDYSFAFGRGHRNTSGNSYVSLFGEGAGQGQSWDFLHACGKFAVEGDCVRRGYVQRGTTTNLSSSTNLTPRFVLQPNQIFHGTIKVTGVKTDGTTHAFYERQVRIIRVNNTTTLLGVNVIGTDVTNGTTLVVTADDLFDSLNIQVTSTGNWRWQAVIDGGSTIFV